MGLQPLDLIILIAYFVVIAAIGFIAQRLVKNREDFVMGGRRFGKAMMIMFAFGAGTHADNAVTVSATSYKYGLSGIWYQWVMVFTMPLYWLLGPIFRRARVHTTADFFERRFGRPMMFTYAFYSLFVMLAFNAVMFYGSAKVIVALTDGAISFKWAVVMMAAVSFLYAIAGGLIAAVWNDFFQGMLTIVMSLLIIPFFWRYIGGLHGFQARLDGSNHPRAHEIFELVLGSDMTILWIVMMTINSLASMVAQPQIMASAAAGKTEMDSRIGFVGGMILKRLMTVPWALTGLMAIAMYGFVKSADPDLTFGRMAKDLLPTGCVGLMLACVMASVMDNCAVNMISFAGIYTNSVHQPLIDRTASERKLLLVNRVSSLVFACASLGLSFLFTDVAAAARFLWNTVPLMGIAWFMAILWSRANRYGAIASFVVALAAAVVSKFVLNWEGDAGLPYAIALQLGSGLAAGIIVSLLTTPEAADRTEQFFLLLKTPIGQEHILQAAGYRVLPGNDTYELPVDADRKSLQVAALDPDQRPGGFEVSISEDRGGGVATAPQVAAAQRITVAQALAQIDNRAARRQTIAGVIALTALIGVMIGGIMILARWLRP